MEPGFGSRDLRLVESQAQSVLVMPGSRFAGLAPLPRTTNPESRIPEVAP
jgi:hypothetical protein